MTNKSVRDTLLNGGTTLLVYNALVELGQGPAVAVLVAALAAFAASTLYRVVRKRWPWLADADPA